jgi:predicted O-linked N-acetylglucosamine transferase (SPINDLY family)
LKTRRPQGRGQPGSTGVAFGAIRASLQTKLSEAIQHHQAGRSGEAEPLYREILAAHPRHPDALHLLGVIAHQTDRLDLAITLLEAAVAAGPRMAEFHNDLGTALRDRERLDESAACFERALALRPDFVPARINLGTILQARGRLDEAVVCYQAAIQLAPDSHEAHNNLAAALSGLGRLDEAIASYRRAVALPPAYATALANLAALLQERGDLPEAESCCRRALALRPDLAVMHDNLGAVLGSMVRLDEAVTSFEQALALSPEDGRIHHNLATALTRVGRIAAAAASYDRAHALLRDPRCLVKRALLLPVIPDSAATMLEARERFAHGLETLIRSELTLTNPEVMGTPAFRLAYHGLDDRALQERLAAFYMQACPSLAWTAPHCTRGPRRAGRLRVGFVSSLLHHHTIGKLTRGLIARLARDRFEVTVFHAGTRDEMARVIGESAERSERLSPALDVARQQIAAAELDIVFYPDIGMEALTYFLAFARLAPVQCVTWGHPVTTGIPALDHFVSSEMLERTGSGALRRAPGPPAALPRAARPTRPSTTAAALLALMPELGMLNRRQIASLGGQAPHPNQSGERDGEGRVVLIAGQSADWAEIWRARFARQHSRVAPRVQFLPRLNEVGFLALLGVADVVLDPIHFGGGNSAYEALGLGVPVVTWPGNFMRGRVTYGCYRQMDIMDCVVADPSAYAARAVELATTPDLRAHVSARLSERADALFEDTAAVRALEDFFERAAGAGS